MRLNFYLNRFMITLLFLVCQLVHVPLYSQFSTGKTVDLNLSTTMTKLKTAPAEGSANAKSKPLLLDLPMPDGTNRAFKVADSPVMSPEMTAAYPMIKTYILQAADDPSVTGRMTVSPYGLHATILSHQGMVGIYPLDPNKPVKHVVELGISKQVQEMSGPHYYGVDEKIEAVVGTLLRHLTTGRNPSPCRQACRTPPPPGSWWNVPIIPASCFSIYRTLIFLSLPHVRLLPIIYVLPML